MRDRAPCTDRAGCLRDVKGPSRLAARPNLAICGARSLADDLNRTGYCKWLSSSEPHTGVFNRNFTWYYIYMCVCQYVCCVPKCSRITWAHTQSQFWEVKTDLWYPCYSFQLYARAALAWMKKKCSHEKLRSKQSFRDWRTDERKAEDKKRK